MAEMKRAYAQLSIKAFDEEARTIRGIATTPHTQTIWTISSRRRALLQTADSVFVGARLEQGIRSVTSPGPR